MIKITKRKENDITVIEVEGTIDLDGVTALKQAISQERQAGCQKLIVDMRKVAKIMSTVLHALQPTVTAFWACHGRIVLANVNTSDLRLLERQPFFKMLSVAETEEDAIRELTL